MFGHHYRQIPPDPTAPFPQRFRIERVYDTPEPTPYDQALNDLVGNEGLEATYACIRIGETMEALFDNDFIQTEEGLKAAREKFEELVVKARDALDTYERKLEDIEERRSYGEL